MCPLIGCFEPFCFPVDGILFEWNESDRGSQGQFRFGREIWPSENSKLEFKIRREPTKATQEWVKYIFQTVQFTLHADTGKNFVKEPFHESFSWGISARKRERKVLSLEEIQILRM